MNHIALFSNDTSLRGMFNQLDDCKVVYFSTELDTNTLPTDITLAVFDFDVVPLSLLDEWEQFPRLHLRKMAIVSAENIDKVDKVLNRLDNVINRPVTSKNLSFRVKQIFIAQQVAYNWSVAIRYEPQNYLTTIKGYSSLLATGQYMEMTNKFIDIIAKNVDAIQKLIPSFHDWDQVEYRQDYDMEAFQIRDEITLLVEDFEKQTSKKNQSFTLAIPDNMPHIHGDKYKIIYVLHSLLQNASGYSNAGSSINLKIDPHEKHAFIIVNDHGMGISSEFYDDVFSQFIRETRAYATDYRGSGLSLYLCKQIIEMHGGKIWFESEVGVGTTFYFTLPLAE